MREFINKKCDCCGESFKEEDDIVVCPECGTPIHRKCWNGHCPNEEKHASGFDWDAENAPKAAGADRPVKREKEDFCCEICGKPFEETDDIVYCAECGTPMHSACQKELGHCPNEHRHAYGYSWDDEHRKPHDVPGPMQIEAASFEEFIDKITRIESENGKERTCFGVNRTELIHFLGINNFSTPRFYSLFFNMADTGRKVSLNFLAGILMPFYQFYRKMIGPSIVLALAYLILDIPQMILTLLMAVQGDKALIPAELYGVVELFFYIFLALRIIVILFNDYIYMRWTVGKILSLREQYREAPEPEYMEALERAGRPRFAFVLIGAAAVSVISYVLLGILSASGYFAA